MVHTDEYRQAASTLGEQARTTAEKFPTPPGIEIHRLAAGGENTDALVQVADRFERLLPPLILNVALLARDRWPDHQLRRSPFPLTDIASREGQP